MSQVELTDDQLNYIVQKVSHNILVEPRCWGSISRVALGHNVHLSNTLFNTSSGNIVIGDDVFFGHNVCLLTGTHDYRKRGAARHEAIPAEDHDIRIANGTWVASGVTILGPCTIGENAVIAAGTLVTGGDLPGGFIYAGTPARMIKAIDFEEEAR